MASVRIRPPPFSAVPVPPYGPTPRAFSTVKTAEREAPTPGLRGHTSAYLAIAQELLEKLGDRPGLTYDFMRGRLQNLEAAFKRWPADPTDIEDRFATIAELTALQRQVRSAMRGER